MRSTARVLVLVLATATLLAGCGGSGQDVGSRESTAPTRPAESKPSATESATPSPTPTPTRVPGTYMIGETSEEFAGGVLTLASIEVLPEVPTVDGATMAAAEGEQMVVFHTHFVNTGTSTVDLTCAGVPNWYITAYDTEQREMAWVGESYRLPGNPECNSQLLSGQEADWTFIFRGLAGSTPRVLQIEDSRTFDDWIAFALTDEPLRLAQD